MCVFPGHNSPEGKGLDTLTDVILWSFSFVGKPQPRFLARALPPPRGPSLLRFLGFLCAPRDYEYLYVRRTKEFVKGIKYRF